MTFNFWKQTKQEQQLDRLQKKADTQVDKATKEATALLKILKQAHKDTVYYLVKTQLGKQ